MHPLLYHVKHTIGVHGIIQMHGHNNVQPCVSGSWVLEYASRIPWSLNEVRVFVYYSNVVAKLGDLGGVILVALCVRILVHFGNIKRKHYSSGY